MSGEKTLSQNYFKQWEVEMYVDKTTENLLKLQQPTSLNKLSSCITKTLGSKYNFAFTAY